MDEHRDEGIEDFDWRADLNQARASARDTAPIVATMFSELRNQGLDMVEAAFLSAAWIRIAGMEFPGEEG